MLWFSSENQVNKNWFDWFSLNTFICMHTKGAKLKNKLLGSKYITEQSKLYNAK